MKFDISPDQELMYHMNQQIAEEVRKHVQRIRFDSELKTLMKQLFKDELPKYFDRYTDLKRTFFNGDHGAIRNLTYMIHSIDVPLKVDAEKWVLNYYRDKFRGFIDATVDYTKGEDLPSLISAWRNHKNHRVGLPDLYIEIHGGKLVMIEVKTNGDGLRYEQLQWIKNHPEIPVIVFHLHQNIDGSVFKE